MNSSPRAAGDKGKVGADGAAKKIPTRHPTGRPPGRPRLPNPSPTTAAQRARRARWAAQDPTYLDRTRARARADLRIRRGRGRPEDFALLGRRQPAWHDREHGADWDADDVAAALGFEPERDTLPQPEPDPRPAAQEKNQAAAPAAAKPSAPPSPPVATLTGAVPWDTLHPGASTPVAAHATNPSPLGIEKAIGSQRAFHVPSRMGFAHVSGVLERVLAAVTSRSDAVRLKAATKARAGPSPPTASLANTRAWLASIDLDALDKLPPTHACGSILAGLGFCDYAARRMERWACALAHRLGVAAQIWLVAVVADVAADSSVLSVPAVLNTRISKLLSGNPSIALSAANRSKTLESMVAPFRKPIVDRSSVHEHLGEIHAPDPPKLPDRLTAIRRQVADAYRDGETVAAICARFELSDTDFRALARHFTGYQSERAQQLRDESQQGIDGETGLDNYAEMLAAKALELEAKLPPPTPPTEAKTPTPRPKYQPPTPPEWDEASGCWRSPAFELGADPTTATPTPTPPPRFKRPAQWDEMLERWKKTANPS